MEITRKCHPSIFPHRNSNPRSSMHLRRHRHRTKAPTYTLVDYTLYSFYSLSKSNPICLGLLCTARTNRVDESVCNMVVSIESYMPSQCSSLTKLLGELATMTCQKIWSASRPLLTSATRYPLLPACCRARRRHASTWMR